ncbi:hypothetical protein PENTCL1PPCAC_5637, partial [Pristionchus entomophagus]
LQMRGSIVRFVSIEALPWDSFIQSVPSTRPESVRKMIEEERPFASAPHAYVDYSYGKSSIIWPGKEFPTVRLSFTADRNMYYRNLKPLQYALSQSLSRGITHVWLHTQNEVLYNVATCRFKGKMELEIFRLLWRAMAASDAPVKARLLLEKGEDQSIKPKGVRDMSELEFVEELGNVVDRLKAL